ncbi:hypothetical protein [Bdellovibrio sp. HCB288]|uniref:hypothetical protein n=1 Tax=Bdellovibrio sp. HCB288 TaxID=3394355 RepID=UPI0039B54D41
MKKHIFVSAFILLTVGCQPNSDGNLLSHSGIDPFTTKSANSDEGTVKTLQRGSVSRLDQTITAGQSSDDSAFNSNSSNAAISGMVFEAVVRLRMDLAGDSSTTPESEAFDKLFESVTGGEDLTFYQALKSNRYIFDLSLAEGKVNQMDINVLAQAFKQAAASYGLDVAAQELISQGILKRTALLMPLASQKMLAAVNGELLQKRVNTLAKSTALKFEDFCPSLSSFVTAAESFYEDKQYVLPTLIKNKIKYIKDTLKSEIAACAKGSGVRSEESMKNVESTFEMVTFDLGSLELYLTPRNDFNWEEYKNFKIKAYLAEALVASKAQLQAIDVDCSVNGEKLQSSATEVSENESVAFEYLVDGVAPIVLERMPSQRGLTLAFVAKDIKITNVKGMSFTKIKPETLVSAINLVPGISQEFSLLFTPKSTSVESILKCKAKGH